MGLSLTRPLAIGYVLAFVAAGALGLLHHTTAAAVTLGAASVAVLLWVASVGAASRRLDRHGGDR